MATQILMPALSPTMTEGKLATLAEDMSATTVRAGDVIAEIETDKATMEVEAVDEGKLAQILVDEGTEGVAVNTPIAVLSVNGEDVSAPPPPAGRGARPCLRSPPRRNDASGHCRAGRRGPAAAGVAGGRGARRRTGGRPSRSPCARRCATRWRWNCAATTRCS